MYSLHCCHSYPQFSSTFQRSEPCKVGVVVVASRACRGDEGLKGNRRTHHKQTQQQHCELHQVKQ